MQKVDLAGVTSRCRRSPQHRTGGGAVEHEGGHDGEAAAVGAAIGVNGDGDGVLWSTATLVGARAPMGVAVSGVRSIVETVFRTVLAMTAKVRFPDRWPRRWERCRHSH